jgi:hypothetical protein
MVLESWLLGICDTDNADVENLLIKLLRESNNVAVTAVVASICNAHPEKAGRAGLAVLTCREFFAMDRARMVREAAAPGGQADLIPTYGVEDKIYDDERRSSAALPHRKHDLETLVIKLQLGEHRHAVRQILDGYRAALPEPEAQTDEDRLWRLALHRMDVRTYQPQLMDAEGGEETSNADSATAGANADRPRQWVYFSPSAIDDDRQEMVDRHAPVQARKQADMVLFNWGIAVWQRNGGDKIDSNPCEVARLVEDLIVVEDQTDGKSPFWDIWQVLADRVRTAGWIHQLDSRYASDAELLHKIFFRLSWKDGVRHWRRLEGFADRVDTLFENLPPCATVLDAYCRFLYTIGEKSLPHGFVVVANRLNAGDASQMLSQDTTVLCLESLLRRFIYSNPLRLKTNVKVRSAILTILDTLVNSGSSAAYRMRDDFVTPIAHQNA